MSQSKTPTIDLVAEARAIPTKPTGSACAVVAATRKRPDLAATIIALLHDTESTATLAADIFTRHNIPISANMVSRHRRNQCTQCKYHGLIS